MSARDRVGARERLARILGPDLLELLQSFVGHEIDETLRRREAERRWLTPEEAAAYLGVSPTAVRKRIARGTLRYSRIGRRLLVDRHALDVQLEDDLR